METETSPRHSVLILTYTKPELVQARLDEMVRFYGSREDVELIIFDNGSEGAAMRLATMPPPTNGLYINTIREHPNVGFGGGWNRALTFARGEFVHLLSDDVRVFGDFTGATEHEFEKAEREIIIGQSLIAHKAGWNEFGGELIPYLMGYYFAMRKDTWDRLGGFDIETFYPYDYEDIDLCYRATKAGIALKALGGLPLHHEVAGTIGYNPQRHEHTVKMRARFAEKWNLPNEPERPG